MNRKQRIVMITVALTAVLTLAVAGSAMAASITSATGDTIEPGDDATVSVQADDVGSVTISDIPTDWEVVDSENDGAFLGPDGLGDSIEDQGSVTWVWDEDQDSVDVSVTLGTPDNVAEQDYDLSVNVEDADGNTDSATVTVTVDDDENGVTPPDELGPGDRELNRYDAPGNGQVVLGPAGDRPRVFQGERNIEFINPDTGEVVTDLTSTDDEDRNLRVPVSTTQREGTYTIDGESETVGVTVLQPEVELVEIINRRGEDVTEALEDRPLAVGADFNFEVAEPLELELFDEGDVEVTGDFLLSQQEGVQDVDDLPEGLLTDAQINELEQEDYDRLWVINFDRAGDYDVTAQADDDGDLIRVDSASLTEVLTIVSDDDAELELDQTTASQGERVDFEIVNGEDGERYIVGIDVRDDRWRSAMDFEQSPGVDPADRRVFRNVGDTERVGFERTAGAEGYYFAELEIDGTTATGRIDTQLLRDTSIDIELLENEVEDPDTGETVAEFDETDLGAGNEVDEVTLDVEEAEITIDGPPRTYVPGMEVDISGSVSPGVDRVDAFVRDRDNYFHVTGVRVDTGDDTYEASDFDLANDARTSDARDIVGQPGVYRYGVIDRQDVFLAQLNDGSNTDGPFELGATTRGAAYAESGETNPATPATGIRDIAGAGTAGLDSADFNRGASTQRSLRVAEPSLEGEFMSFDGQIFRPDGVDVTGELIGPRAYLVLFTDARGNTQVEEYTADRDTGEIDEEALDVSDLRDGNVQATILSPGRDRVFGDGTFSISDSLQAATGLNANPDATIDNFVIIAEALGDLDRTQSQVREILLDQTVEDAGSDDLLVSDQFRLTGDSRTQIVDVVPDQLRDDITGVHPIEVGETMVIRGITNRNPDDATIVVEADEGPAIAELDVGVTDEWGQDGIWSVDIEVSEEVEPGTYVMRSDDGERIDEQEVEIVAEGTLEPGERERDDAEQLRQEIQELQDEIAALEGERDDLQNRVNELEADNQDLRDQIAAMEEEDDDDDDEVTDEVPPEEEQPGFTAVAALIALIAVALLALRRREE